jgi:mono/diheme cytochrome c family protein
MKNCLLIATLAFTFSTCVLAEDSSTQIYKGRCVTCHGEDGKGNAPEGKKLKTPDLGATDVQNKSDAELAKIISDGKGKMPKFGGKLTKDQIRDLVTYIRKFKPVAPAIQMFGAI